MKKILLIIILISITPVAAVFAGGSSESESIEPSAWFSPYAAGFNVNLMDTDTYCGKKDGEGFDSAGYNDKTLIGVIGATRLNTTVTVSITASFSADNWYYVSASEPYLKRPFGLDLVVVQGSDEGEGTISETYHFGYQKAGNNNNIEVSNTQLTLELSSTNSKWIDVVLVLPSSSDNNADLSAALAKDDYYADLNITFSGTVNGTNMTRTWPITLSGYIGNPPDITNENIFLNIIPNATANSIDINDLTKHKVNVNSTDSSTGITIGTYEYQSIAYRTDAGYNEEEGKNYLIFASASEDPTDGSKSFELVLSGLESSSGVDSSFKFNYLIGLQSTESDAFFTNNDWSQQTKWFDGKLTSDRADSSNALRGRYRDEFMRNNTHSLTFFDEGNILIALPENSTVSTDKLTAGIYTSTVYFHVVSTQ